MLLTATIVALAASLLQVQAQAGNMMINTVTAPTECVPVQFTWSGGQPPYYLSLVPGGQPGAAAIKQFPAQNDNSFTWTIDVPAGTSFTTQLRDKTGAIAYSDVQTVEPGADNGCLTASQASASAAPPAAAAANQGPSAAATNKAAATSTAANAANSASGIKAASSSSSASSSTSTHPSSTSSASPSSTSRNAAVGKQLAAGSIGFVKIGLASLLGCLCATLLG